MLPILLLIVCQLTSTAWGTATQVPPLTTPFSTATAPSGASSSTSVSASNSSTTATPTSSAQFPSLSGYSSCVSQCLALGSSAANCTSVVDVNCFCISTNFTQSFTGCITQGCPAELSSAEALAQQFCNVASSKPSLSFSITSIPSSSSSSSSTVSIANTTTTTPTTTSSAPSTSTTTSKSSAGTDGLHSIYGTLMGLLAVGLAIHVME